MPSTSSQKSIPSTNNDFEQPLGKIEIAGDGGEFIIINNHKYYRHDLMSAFGGTLNPGASPYPTFNINPAPVGLCGFAMTTFVLSLYNAQAMGIKIPNIVVSLACFYGGAVQFLAGMFEWLSGNTFGLTALVSYGAFWLSFAAIYLESFGIGAAYENTDQLANSVGFFLLGWAIFTLMLFLTTLKSTVSFSSLFFFLFVTFLLLAGGELSGRVGVSRAGGVFGVITAFIAWWNALAGTANPLNSYFQPYSIPLPGNVVYGKSK